MSQVQTLLTVVSDLRSLADSLQTLAGVIGPNEAVQEAKPAAPATPPISIEQVRAVLADKSRSGKTVAVRELLKKFGAAKLSEIDPARYAELLPEAEAL